MKDYCTKTWKRIIVGREWIDYCKKEDVDKTIQATLLHVT